MTNPAKSVASALGLSARRKYADDPAHLVARLDDEKRCRQVLHSFIAPLIAANVPRGTGRRTLGFLRTIARHLNGYSPATLQRAAQAVIADGRAFPTVWEAKALCDEIEGTGLVPSPAKAMQAWLGGVFAGGNTPKRQRIGKAHALGGGVSSGEDTPHHAGGVLA
jgi:hypothetical protein